MKKILFIFFIVLMMKSPVYSQTSWTLQFDYPQGKFNKLEVVNKDVAYIACDSGKILKTINGGNSWSFINLPVKVNVYQISFLNAATGIIIQDSMQNTIQLGDSYRSFFYKTTNGGNNWSLIQDISDYKKFTSLKFTNANNVYATYMVFTEPFSLRGGYMHSVNGGSNFTFVFDNELPCIKIDFINPNTGWLFRYSTPLDTPPAIRFLYKTVNGGTNWSLIKTDTIVKSSSRPYHHFDFVDENTGYYFNKWRGPLFLNVHILKTTDSGNEWSFTDTLRTAQDAITSFDFINSLTGYGCGYDGTIIKTVNSGTSWTSTRINNDLFNEIKFSGIDTGWVISSNKIYKSVNGPEYLTYFPFQIGNKWFIQFKQSRFHLT